MLRERESLAPLLPPVIMKFAYSPALVEAVQSVSVSAAFPRCGFMVARPNPCVISVLRAWNCLIAFGLWPYLGTPT